MGEKMILTSECEKCSHCSLDESNKAKIIIHCNLKDHDYIYGQRIKNTKMEIRFGKGEPL